MQNQLLEVHVEQNPGTVRRQLAQSGSQPLRVVMQDSPDRALYWEPFLEAVLPHASRWATFVFDMRALREFPDAEKITRANYAFLGRRTRNLHLPSLTKLCLLYPHPLMLNRDADNDYESDIRFFVPWSMPNLRELVVMNFFPVRPYSKSLRSCELVLNTFAEGPEWDLEEMGEFLGALSSLETLSLTIVGATSDDESRDIAFIRLPNLRSFSLTVGEDTDFETFRSIMDKLVMRHVVTMSISMTLCERKDAEAWVQSVFPDVNDYAHLKELSVNLLGRCLSVNSPLLLILERFQRLQRLSIHAPTISAPRYWPNPFPRIQFLTLSNCRRFAVGDIARIAQTIRPPSSTRLRIVGYNAEWLSPQCMHQIAAAFPAGHVEWVPLEGAG